MIDDWWLMLLFSVYGVEWKGTRIDFMEGLSFIWETQVNRRALCWSKCWLLKSLWHVFMKFAENIEAISPTLWLLCAPPLNITAVKMRLCGRPFMRKVWKRRVLKSLCFCRLFEVLRECNFFLILMSSVQVVTRLLLTIQKSEKLSLCVLSEICCRWSWANPCSKYEQQNVSTAVTNAHSWLLVNTHLLRWKIRFFFDFFFFAITWQNLWLKVVHRL